MSLAPLNPNPSNQAPLNGLSSTNGPVGFPGGPNAMPGLDIYGGLMRRKFLVILIGIVGCLLGYLYFSKQPNVYASSLRLMIWTQNPPKIVDGDQILRQSTTPKHKNLLSSELVLKNAVKNGNLQNLEMFKGSPFPESVLKRKLSIQSASKDDETIILTCSGPNAEELPTVLNQIVFAYREILDQESRTFGREMADLIEKYQDKTAVRQLATREKRYMELAKQHNFNPDSEIGEFVNPYLVEVKDLRQERQRLAKEKVNLELKLKKLKAVVESEDKAQMVVLAIEARKHLGHEFMSPRVVTENPAAVRDFSMNYAQQIAGYRREIFSRLDQRAELARIYGSGSPKIQAIDKSIKGLETEIRRIEAEQNKLASATTNTDDVDINAIREAHNRDAINLYQISLSNLFQEVELNLEQVISQLQLADQASREKTAAIAELNVLKRQINDESEARKVILDQLAKINVLSNDYTKYKVRVIDPPKAGGKVAPDFFRCLGIGTLLGALVGSVLALLVDRLDMNFRNPTEIVERLGIPVIGRVPRIRVRGIGKGVKGNPTLITAHNPSSSSAEAFRAVRTAMFFAASESDCKTFLFTSPSPGDGKSTVCCNLAISLAQTGKRVLLLDADFRRPRIHQYFGEEIEPGIVGVLNGDISLRDAISPSMQENLFLLPTGGRPKNPGELVTSPEFEKIIKAVRSSFDFVLIDSPPVLPVADPTVLSSKVDGVYLVMRIRKGVKVSSQNAKDNLDRVNSNTIGIIVNGLDENPHYSEYGYYYPYNAGYMRYYDSEKKNQKKQRPRAITNANA